MANTTTTITVTNTTTNTTINTAINNPNNLASKLNVLNIKSIYYFTLFNEFHKDDRFLNVIDHRHNTRRRAQGRYKIKQFFNEYGRNELSVILPTIYNRIPTNIISENNVFRRKKLLKKFFLVSQ